MIRRHHFLTSTVLTPSSFFSLIFSQWIIFYLVQVCCPSHTWPLPSMPSAFKWMMYPKGKIHIEFFSNYPLLLSTTISILDLFIFRKFTPQRTLILLTTISFHFLFDCLLKKFQGDLSFSSMTSVRHLINWLSNVSPQYLLILWTYGVEKESQLMIRCALSDIT